MKFWRNILIFVLILLIFLSGCSPKVSSEQEPLAQAVEEVATQPTEEEPPAEPEPEPEPEPEQEPVAEETSDDTPPQDQPVPEAAAPAEQKGPVEITEADVEAAYIDEVEMETVTQQEVAAVILDAAPAVPTVLATVASGTKTEENDEAIIDYSNTGDGYIMVKYTGSTQSRLKVLVKGPYTTYKYDLPKNSWTVFPLSDGNGTYQVGVYRNVSGTKYATVLSAQMQVSLYDRFAPFLRPNQYVNYWNGSAVVELGAQVVSGADHNLKKVEKVYDYVVANLSYDYNKAATVQSGYLPVLDQVLQTKKGICFDYAALMTAMLRSQDVPCKLMVGYAGQTYHAWINVWTEESGWVDGVIFFDGSVWKRMDPTYASSAGQSTEIMDFISRDVNYAVKYQY